MLTAERLRELLHYDPETGVFTRRVTRTNAPAGSIAGSRASNGYLTIHMEGKAHKAHRLAWLYVNGVWPKALLDHRDRDKSNNRINNLREANNSQNLQNRIDAYVNSSSGLLGVYWHAQGKKWQSRIQVNKKARSLGFFETKEEAHAAYLAAKRELHPFST